MRNAWRAGLAAAVALLVAACGGKPDPDDLPDRGSPLEVVIENGGVIPGQVRVTLIPESGGQSFTVGTLATLATGTLRTRIRNVGGSYRLRAESGRHVLVSPPFPLSGDDSVTWEMDRNVVLLNP